MGNCYSPAARRVSMAKKAISILVLTFLLFSLAGCAPNSDDSSREPISAGSNGIAQGEVGDTMRTPILDFTVTETKALSQYSKKDPMEGEKYVLAIVNITNTSGAAITLHDTDFQLQWGISGFADTMVPWDDRMAPMETTLEAGKTITYHYLYSVSTPVTQFKFCYLYEGSDKNQIYYVDFTF